MQVGPWADLHLGVDGRVRRINGGKLEDTRILAAHVDVTEDATVGLKAFVLHPGQIDDAVRELVATFPPTRGKITIAQNPPTPRIGGLATSDLWLVYDQRIAFHPLAVRLGAYKNTLANLRAELAQEGISDLL